MVFVSCSIAVDKLKPTAALDLFMNSEEYKNRPTLLKMVESVKKDGILYPIIIDNIDDDGTYKVRIGNRRLFIAQLLDIKAVEVIVNCRVGQKYIPEGTIITSMKDVEKCFNNEIGRVGWLGDRFAVVSKDWEKWS